jgi:hypothetical protein
MKLEEYRKFIGDLRKKEAINHIPYIGGTK